MKLKIGDYVLVKTPKFGYSDQADLGPFIVTIVEFNLDGFYAGQHLNQSGFSKGKVLWSEVVTKIHDRDVETLFREEYQ